MPINRFKTYVKTDHDHFIMGLAGTLLIGLELLTHPSLREFSSVVSVVCLMGLLWRIIGNLRKMTVLSVMLAASLALNLATGAVAQYLLSRQIAGLSLAPGVHSPDNTIGITLVLLSRLFILFVIIMWNRWLSFPEGRKFLR